MTTSDDLHDAAGDTPETEVDMAALYIGVGRILIALGMLAVVARLVIVGAEFVGRLL
jgi:hypothetical protein